MPGYDISPTDAAEAEQFLCPCCHKLLREAMQTSCGHFYCASCLEDLSVFDCSTKMLKCKKCESTLPLNEIFPDKFTRRQIETTVFHCAFRENGCKWKGQVMYLDQHYAVCDSCTVSCVHPGCSVKVTKAHLQHHLVEECQYRLTTCEFCKKRVPFGTLEAPHYERDCPKFPVECESCKGEGVVFAREMLKEHQDKFSGDCSGIEGPCPYSTIGCSSTKTLSRGEKKQHLLEQNVRHTFLVFREIVRIGDDANAREDPSSTTRAVNRAPPRASNDNIISDIISQMQCSQEETRQLQKYVREVQGQRITSLERKLVAGVGSAATPATVASVTGSENGGERRLDSRRMINLENKVADHEVLLVESNRNVQEVQREMTVVRRAVDAVQETGRRLERRIDSIEHALALRNVTLADMEEYFREREFSTYDGTFLWKISEFARRRNEAVSGQQVSFLSPCFFTGRYGYKMCARIYLNGDGMGRGTHISVFFVVMRGMYDALLRWPFRQKVTFMLVDQDNVEHVIDAFRPDPNSSSFQRPRRETNIASGCPTFCSLTELNNHAYVRDDALFLKIIVDTSDLRV